MTESQNIEHKALWKDDYLKWICGFANAQGGKIFIGINNNGKIVGINTPKKLMEDIPNKVRDILGIIIDVNLRKEENKSFLELNIEAYPYPVNYKGKYFYRTGSTLQELRGAALDRFMLKKKGKKWDAIPVPHIKTSDLKKETLELFKHKAVRSRRIDENIDFSDNELLIENLQLKENDYLKNSAVLLFHPNPEKFVTGAYIKIGYFETDVDLIFQDEVHGNLFEQIEKTMDLLFTKYIKAIISYEGIQRIETYEYPYEAVREAILNAVSHKDYTGFVPIQISVYSDKIMIWNYGRLPENWTVDKLKTKHSSNPYNPDIANAFFRSGYIESWGRGTIKMIDLCKQNGIPPPDYYFDNSDFWVVFKKDIYNKENLKSYDLNNRQINAVIFAKENGKITNKEYQQNFEVSRITATRDLSELVIKGLLKSSETKGAGSYYELNN